MHHLKKEVIMVKTLSTAVFSILILCNTASAQSQQPDRKDFIISSLQTQRNDALDKEAVCRADTSSIVEQLKAELVARSKEVESLKTDVAAHKKD
jgi:hypothetical protein